MATYAFSDLHAQYDLWQQIKEYIKPTDKVYCLGDCVDRGYTGLDILQEVMDTPNITLLRGNHEDFIDSIGYQLTQPKEDLWNGYYENLGLWQMNGANRTIKEFKTLSRAKQLVLIRKIRELPTHCKYKNAGGRWIYLSHSGAFNSVSHEIPDMQEGDIPMNNYIWDRWHISQAWDGGDEIVVHGHTPVGGLKHYLATWMSNIIAPTDNAKIFTYCDGHKIDIDLGSFMTHTACLLNLDTLEPIYFKDRTIKENNNE